METGIAIRVKALGPPWASTNRRKMMGTVTLVRKHGAIKWCVQKSILAGDYTTRCSSVPWPASGGLQEVEEGAIREGSVRNLCEDCVPRPEEFRAYGSLARRRPLSSPPFP